MIPLAVGLGVAAGTGLASYLANKSANDRAEMIQDRNFQDWMNLNIPNPEEQKIALQKFVSTGEMSPVMQHAISQSPSEFQKIVTNPAYQGAQNKALSQLSQIGEEGGLRLQDKVALQDARIQAQTRERSQRQGIADEMARRGGGNNGFGVAARLSGISSSADRESQAGLQTASDAQNRALQAIMGAGNLAGQYRSQDFGEQAQKASAADRINAFNTANLRDVNAANVGAENYSNEYNLKNKQRISDSNTQLANVQEQHNKGLVQQQYENQLSKLRGATGQSNEVAKTDQRGGQLTGNAISNIGGAASNYALLDNYFGKGSAPASSVSTDSASSNGYSISPNAQASLDKIKENPDEENPYYVARR